MLPSLTLGVLLDRHTVPLPVVAAQFGCVALISAPMFCLVIFQGVSSYFVSAASDSYSPMGQMEV
jgi:hypothetical protein